MVLKGFNFDDFDDAPNLIREFLRNFDDAVARHAAKEDWQRIADCMVQFYIGPQKMLDDIWATDGNSSVGDDYVDALRWLLQHRLEYNNACAEILARHGALRKMDLYWRTYGAADSIITKEYQVEWLDFAFLEFFPRAFAAHPVGK